MDAEEVVIHLHGPFHGEQVVFQLADVDFDLVHVGLLHGPRLELVEGVRVDVLHVVEVLAEDVAQPFADEHRVIGVVDGLHDVQLRALHLLGCQLLGDFAGLDADDPLPAEEQLRQSDLEVRLVFQFHGLLAESHAVSEVGTVINRSVDLRQSFRHGFPNHFLPEVDVHPRGFQFFVVLDRVFHGLLQGQRLRFLLGPKHPWRD